MSEFDPHRDVDDLHDALDAIDAEITQRMGRLDKGDPQSATLFQGLSDIRKDAFEARLLLTDASLGEPTKAQIDTHYGKLGSVRRAIEQTREALRVQES
jgi:hypothetical protein